MSSRRSRYSHSSRSRAATRIEIACYLVTLLGVAAIVLVRYQGGVERANHHLCQHRQEVLNTLIHYYYLEFGEAPAKLNDLLKLEQHSVPQETDLFRSPITGEAYEYDPVLQQIVPPQH